MSKPKYNDDFPLLAEDYARRGMIDKEIARMLGIARWTFYRYQKEHSDFCDALKRGKAPVDVEVENSLLKRAKGYEYEEITAEFRPKDKKGKKDKETAKPVLIRKTTKQIIPDVTAQIFWLKNRRPEQWRDRQEHDHTVNLILSIARLKKSLKEYGEDEARG